ncbi:MAG: sigma-70 family RNA polymerase sigma factor [Ferruginibacter sp.]
MELFYIKQIIDGDLNRFSYFVEKYKDMAFTIAVRIVNNNEDAEEVVQDSFLKAYRSLRQFRGDAKFSTWLFKIVITRALSKTKRKKLSTLGLDEAEDAGILMEDPESVSRNLKNLDQKKYIDQAMEQLNMDDRLLLTLYYLNENTIAEIADMTLLPAENIKMKLHRARKKCTQPLLKF